MQINVTEEVSPSNVATVDKGTLVGNTLTKIQIDEKITQVVGTSYLGVLPKSFAFPTTGSYTFNPSEAGNYVINGNTIAITAQDFTDYMEVLIRVTSGLPSVSKKAMPPLPIATTFDKTDAVKAQSGKTINDYFFGTPVTTPVVLSTKTFTGTSMTSYPLGLYDSNGVFQKDTVRRVSGKIDIPSGCDYIVLKNFNAQYRGVFLTSTNAVVSSFLTDNNVNIIKPSNATKIELNIKSATVEVDLNAISIDFVKSTSSQDKKVVSPTDLEDRINKRINNQTVEKITFSQYADFNSFQSGVVNANGTTSGDATNVRKLSPKYDIAGVTMLDFHMSIVGAYYTITDASNVVLKFGILGVGITVPSSAKYMQFTIKGSSSQANLLNDYFDQYKGEKTDFIVLESDLKSINSNELASKYIQISKANALGTATFDQWENYSDGAGNVTVAENGLKLLDNITAVNNQAKIRTLKFSLSNVFSVFMSVKFLQLNNSYNMDILDGVINGYGETNETGDDNINKSGFSFAVIHPTLAIRPIFSIVKAIDYETSGNLEIWRIVKPANFVAGFERIWSGKEIPMNAFFDMQIDFEFNTQTNKNYYISIVVAGKRLVHRSLMGMESNYGGQGSLLFQCKGIASDPAEYIVKNIKVLQNDSSKGNLLNYIVGLI